MTMRDVNAGFVASDGKYYASLADRLLGNGVSVDDLQFMQLERLNQFLDQVEDEAFAKLLEKLDGPKGL